MDRGVRLKLVSSLAAMLAVALFLDVPAAVPRRDPRAPLLAATESGRPVLPRLTGGFAWAPLDEPLRSLDSRAAPGAEPGRWRYFAAAEEVRKGAEAAADAEGIGALGAANLMVGNVDEAVALLERAVAREPSDARLRSDLAAALIARGMAREGTDDLARALESASSALTLSTDLPEARFNRALALELLPLPNQARREWRQYAAADPSRWGREAEERLRRLADPAMEDGPTVRARLEAAALGPPPTATPPALRRWRSSSAATGTRRAARSRRTCSRRGGSPTSRARRSPPRRACGRPRCSPESGPRRPPTLGWRPRWARSAALRRAAPASSRAAGGISERRARRSRNAGLEAGHAAAVEAVRDSPRDPPRHGQRRSS